MEEGGLNGLQMKTRLSGNFMGMLPTTMHLGILLIFWLGRKKIRIKR